MAPSACSRSGLDRTICRRLRDGLRERGRCPADDGRPQGSAGQVRPVDARAQDAADRVWPASGHGPTAAWRAASGDLRLPRLHPLLRVDPGRQVHCEAQDAEPAPDAQAEGTAPGGVAADARTTGRAAPLVFQHLARPLRLLRHAAQLARTERVLAGSSAHLVQLPPAAQPEEPTHGLELVRGSDRALSLAATTDHASLDTKRGPMRVTSGKSRVRESRLPGSVRAEPNGRATRPRSYFALVT